ncbi:MAG: sugar ABC transporter permease [Elusimicrobiota bacterium]|nr:sugar ABC transporter permease [Endomicrobiia bacterium]MCX7845594.1 sugar ABC transporter permease [Dictyoglomaceae bacterium]MDW7973309.1 sugar ABC transporter permease [Thermodesulfovibrio sp.]MDW8166525.1 sugar ABC transporter permease [Elusimicrobiota bacterium]
MHLERSNLIYRWEKRVFPFLLLLPAFILIIGVVAYPIVRALWLSFHNYNPLKPHASEYTGFENYLKILRDSVFSIALRNSIFWIIGVVLFQFLGGLLGALILRQNFRGRSIVRGLSLIPWVTPSILIAIMWIWMLDGNYGIINDILLKLGIISKYIPWLAQKNTALPSVMIADIWRGIPFFAIMLLAAMEAIPEELYEAAKIDGAGPFKIFTHITWPLILPTVIITTMLRIIWTANHMDLILIMTDGGPGFSSLIIPLMSYHTAYKQLNFGYGATIAILQGLFLIIFISLYLRLLRKRGSIY